jgi:excisionase family DNA binding protein
MLLLTPDEVAEILRVSPRHVRRLAANGVIQRIQLGARTARYTAESVDALLVPTTSKATADDGDLAEAADTGGRYGTG